MTSTNLSRLARKILGYLADNPQAKDTIDGLTEWWLLQQRVVDLRREVETAVLDLVSRGVVEATPFADGRVLYSLSSHADHEVARLLAAEGE